MADFKQYLIQFWLRLHVYIDIVVDWIFGCFYTSQSVPKTDNPILLKSAKCLAKEIRERKLTSETVVLAFINRIKEVNPIINAVVCLRFDAALEEAKQVDQLIKNGKANFAEKPFLGVPFTAKESTACSGMPYTFGLVCRKKIRAAEDATVVDLMKKAGGILLGVTNIPSLNLWQETFNPIYGLTRNPYDTSRTVGGSAGGEAAIVAAGGSPIGLGTDIGGSTRIPCFMCGVFGHKITNGFTSTKGLTYRTGQEKNTMVCNGPIVRHAEDLLPLVKVLTNNSSQLKLDETVDLDHVEFYYMSENYDILCSPIGDETKKVFNRVLEFFNFAVEKKPKKVHFENVKYGGRLWRHWMTQEEGANFKLDIANRKKEVNPILELLKYPVWLSDYDLPVMFNLINGLLPAVDQKWARETTEQLREEILETLGNNGVLLFPSAPFPASYHYTAFFRPWNFHYFCIWNALKLPVTQVPLGLSKDGLPLGIQVVAAPNQDRLCIAVAEELERKFGGHVMPPVL